MNDNKKPIPNVLLHKMIFTALLGAGCLLAGIVHDLTIKDFSILIQSFTLFAACILKSILLYWNISRQQYRTLEGVCTGCHSKPFSKHLKVSICDEDNKSIELILDKRSRISGISVGNRYRFYFSQLQNPRIGNQMIDAALSVNQFYGFEEVPEEVPETEGIQDMD